MNKDQIKALLALNEEQIALLEEWNDLKDRMEKANGNIEDVVDKYVKCETPELRQQVIDGIRQMVKIDMLDDIKKE